MQVGARRKAVILRCAFSHILAVFEKALEGAKRLLRHVEIIECFLSPLW